MHVITPDVLRGLRAIACALTAPQAEHPDVRKACEWLLAVGSEGSAIFDSATRRMSFGTRALDRDRLRQAAQETRDEYVRNQWLNADHILSAVVNRVVDEIEGKIEDQDEEGALNKTKSSAWWDEHTVIRLVVTHLNKHGARVLFSLPGRGIDLVAETSEQAERQLAFARERWPEGVYEVREARFWRDADGRPGDPVHTLIDDGFPQDRSRTCGVEERTACSSSAQV